MGAPERLVDERVAGDIGDHAAPARAPGRPDPGPERRRGARPRDPGELAARGIEVIRVERGGEVTYHGPGQLVAYPILALSRRGLLLRPFVRALEGAMLDTCLPFGVDADRRDGHPGCWGEPDGPRRARSAPSGSGSSAA